MESRILYLDQELDEVSLRLRRALSKVGGDHRIEHFPTDKALLDRLLGPLDDILVAVVRVRDREHLRLLTLHSMFLRGIRVVVVLPEMGHEVVTIAHIFHPSLVLSVADDFDEIAAIVEKLIHSEAEDGCRSMGTPPRIQEAAKKSG